MRPVRQQRLCFIIREQVNADMTITFKLELRDLYVFNGYIQKHSSARRRLRLFAFMFLAAVMLFRVTTVEDADMTTRVVMFAVGFPVGCIVYLCLIWLLRRIALWRAFTAETQRSLLCEHTITLTDDALLEVTPFGEGKNLWKGVYQVVDTPEYIYIFATQYSAHVVPKRAFADAEEAHRFHQYAAALHAAAMSKVP